MNADVPRNRFWKSKESGPAPGCEAFSVRFLDAPAVANRRRSFS